MRHASGSLERRLFSSSSAGYISSTSWKESVTRHKAMVFNPQLWSVVWSDRESWSIIGHCRCWCSYITMDRIISYVMGPNGQIFVPAGNPSRAVVNIVSNSPASVIVSSSSYPSMDAYGMCEQTLTEILPASYVIGISYLIAFLLFIVRVWHKAIVRNINYLHSLVSSNDNYAVLFADNIILSHLFLCSSAWRSVYWQLGPRETNLGSAWSKKPTRKSIVQ